MKKKKNLIAAAALAGLLTLGAANLEAKTERLELFYDNMVRCENPAKESPGTLLWDRNGYGMTQNKKGEWVYVRNEQGDIVHRGGGVRIGKDTINGNQYYDKPITITDADGNLCFLVTDADGKKYVVYTDENGNPCMTDEFHWDKDGKLHVNRQLYNKGEQTSGSSSLKQDAAATQGVLPSTEVNGAGGNATGQQFPTETTPGGQTPTNEDATLNET
ncbi:MAG: hypothetical protein LBH47_01595, partial [Christensenellaceae bacterium]|nr:hypothetical protein [Christensenellaceae bacterium]